MAKRLKFAALAAVVTAIAASVIAVCLQYWAQAALWVEYNTAIPGAAVALAPIVLYVFVLVFAMYGRED